MSLQTKQKNENDCIQSLIKNNKVRARSDTNNPWFYFV